ncbi:MAG: hypothetical protein ABDH49_06090 [Candidatus Hydrothermales bacterium]
MKLKGSLLFLLFILLLSVYKAAPISICPDFYWYLMDGKYFIENKELPQNVYTYLPSEKWIAHSLAFEVLLYVIYKNFGDVGLYIFKIVLLTILYSIVIFIVYEKSKKILNFLIVYFLVFSLLYWGTTVLRPHIFTYISTALILLAIEKRRYELIPIVLLFFSFFHAGIVVSIIISVIYFLAYLIDGKFRESKKIIFLTSLGIFLIVIFNPYHLDYFDYIIKALFKKSKIWENYVSEWESIFISAFWEKDYYVRSLLLAPIFLIVMLFILSPRKKLTIDIFLLIAFYYSSLKHVRNIPIFGIVSAFIIPPYLNEILKPKLTFQEIDNKLIFKILILLINFFIIVKIITEKEKVRVEKTFFPIEAVEFIKNYKKEGNILCPSDRGGFIQYKLFPNFKISVDGRLSVPDTILLEHFKFWNLEIDPWNYIKKYKTEFILTENKFIITKVLKKRRELKAVYNDEYFTVFELKRRDK